MARSSEKSRPSIFWFLSVLIVPFVGYAARIRVRGGENLPREGAYVLAPNHYSEFDPLIVAVVSWRLGRAPRFLARDSLFRVPVLGSVLRATGMVPVARATGGAASAIAQGEQLVDTGRGVIVYPEGTLTRDPDLWPMRGKSGAARIALAADIPVIPMAQWGTQQILPRYGKIKLWPPRRPIEVAFGAPVRLNDLRGGTPNAHQVAEGTERIMTDITALLADIRGETAPAERWDPAAHGQSETGKL
ncbi:MAG: lysophospholipid acyltransferase family protein [Microbacterium sp.]